MGAVRVVLLVLTVLAVLVGHRRVGPPVVVLAGVGFALVTTAVAPSDAVDAVRPLVEPLAFLLLAVPMAVLLDRIGFFDAAAERFALGHRIRPSLWAFAAVVTTLFNLDAAVVLLTPLYLRIARRHGLDPITTALQPILLASLASSALPVSNLTNLIVAESTGAGVAEFALRLGPASLAATVVGWFAFRRVALAGVTPVVASGTVDARALRIGLPVVAVLLAGFTVGDAAGIPPWSVVLGVVIALAVVVREVPLRSLPLGAAAVAAGLAVLAASASPHLGLDRVLGGSGVSGDVTALLAGVVGADAVSNLPALLVGLPHLTTASSVWAFLAGVNMGPVLWAGGSLAGLLWLDTMRRFGHEVTPSQYARIGVRVGVPALLVAGAVVVTTGAVV